MQNQRLFCKVLNNSSRKKTISSIDSVERGTDDIVCPSESETSFNINASPSRSWIKRSNHRNSVQRSKNGRIRASSNVYDIVPSYKKKSHSNIKLSDG